MHGTIYREAKTWTKRIEGSIHMLRKPRAICVSKKDLDRAVQLGIETLIVTDIETSTEYQTTLERLKRLGKLIQRPGFEQQMMLPLEYWSIDGHDPQRNGRDPVPQQVQIALL